MNTRSTFQFGISVVCCGVLVVGCSCVKTQRSADIASAPNDVICSTQYEPVCGADGTTYANECVATQQNQVKIMYRGECAGVSDMDDRERKDLVWLLRQRDEAGLPSVSIKHLTTTDGSCAGCYTLFYAWGEPRVIARLIVESGTITSAIDTLGYDYLEKEQGVPVDFPELIGDPALE